MSLSVSTSEKLKKVGTLKIAIFLFKKEFKNQFI